MSATGAAAEATMPAGATQQPSTPLLPRVASAAFLFAAYFGLCAALALSGAAVAATRPTPAGIVMFLIACLGLTLIAVDSAAAHPFRELASRIPLVGKGLYVEELRWNEAARQWIPVPAWGVLTCAMCTGMWAGTAIAAMGWGAFPIAAGGVGIQDLVAHGLAGSAWCFSAHVVLSRLGAFDS